MKRIVFLFLVLFTFHSSYSLDFHWNLEPIVIKNGLDYNTIYDICYGKDGFVWLSTDQGITRYDGFKFRNYSLIASIDSVSIALPQAVKKISEASDGLLYVQLYQGGFVGFDKAKEKFLSLRFNNSFKQREILDFYCKDETLFLATSHGLYEAKVVRSEKNEEDFMFCSLTATPLVKGKVTHLCSDGKSNLYFSVDGKRIQQYNIITHKNVLIQEYDLVNKLFFQNGYLWICKMWTDVICYDLKKRKGQVIVKGTVDKVDYSNSYVTGLVCRDKRTFYLTTWDGLFELDFDQEDLCESRFTLTPLTQQGEGTFYSKVEGKMTSVLWDNKQRILWVGTFGGGVVKFDQSDSMYSSVQQKLGSRVCGMVEDEKGYIWLVRGDGGIMKSTTPGLSVYTHFELWEKFPGFLGCHCIYKDKNGILWLGNNQGEVVCINPLTEDLKNFHLRVNDESDPLINIHQFCMDSRNRLWVATSKGLMRVDLDSQISEVVEPLGGKIEMAYSIAEDKEGNIWIGTNKGLKSLERVGEQFHLKGNFEKENGLEEMTVRTIYVNNYNQIYAAYFNSVIRIDGRSKDKVESIYTLKKGLTSGHVCCMVDDQLGNTWAGNNVGIMTIRNGQEAFYNYLPAGNCSAVCRLNDGRLLWANSWGLIFFDPALTKEDRGNKQLMLTDVEVNGKSLLAGEERNGQTILSLAPEKQKSLVFNADNNDFCLYFSDLRYGMMQRKIAYRLLPQDEEWKMKPLDENLNYSGLSAGEYLLEVKLVFPDASEGEIIQLPITVKARWFQTFWAYLSYGLLVVLSFYLFYRFLAKRRIRRQTQQDREVILKEKLNVEKMKHEQTQEVEAIRNRLLLLFVQELRTPLSLIIGPLKDLLKDKTLAPDFASRGQVAYRNSLRMLDACNQLLAVSGQGKFNEKLEIALYQVEKLIDNNLFDVRELLNECAINFQYEKRIKKEMEIYVDKRKVGLIIHYLLTNAFTHVNYAGNVSLTVCEVVQEKMSYLAIVIEDNGKVEVSSTELGFSMIKELVVMHHGSISLESENEKGTKVTVNFPIGKKMFEQDPNVTFIVPEELSDLPFETLEASQTKAEAENVEQNKSSVSLDKALVAGEVAPSSSKGGKTTLLIIEDHKDIRLYLKVLLGKEYNLLMATNGQEGIDIAVKELPDLILCDVMMPVKDGFECCRELKEGLDTCSIPFIMLTAKVEDEDIIHGLELGADDYVLKPFTPGILKAKIHNLINGRQSLKQMYTKLFRLPGTDTAVTNETEQTEEGVRAEDPFISTVIKIVEENICEPDFSVKKLASDMNMSQPTLYRKVKQSTDYTIIELIRGVRIRRAAVLLKTKQYSVQDVAEMVGYNDIPTFRKHFVDAFGTTPSTYE